MQHRTSYDTSVKHLCRKGLEEAIPLSLRKTIPRNTIHRWRQEKDDKYIGCELNKLANSEIEMLKEFVKSRNAKRIFMTYVRIGRFIQSMSNDKFMKQQFKKHRMDLIDIVERARKSIPFKQVLKCFNLSATTYNLWVLEIYSGCSKSPLDWCFIKQPHQLKVDEVEKMKEMLEDETIEHWPISSVAHHARREGFLFISNSTWYKYAKLLGLRRKKPKFARKNGAPGIKAVRPNEIWHADVTYFKIGLKIHYISLVVDNFSRKILSHLVSDTLNATNRLLTIKQAYESEFNSIEEDLTLLVDGGSENNNNLVENYIHLLPNLTKLRALHDIRFGNTQIEAHNKLLKQGWLYRKEFKNEEELKEALEIFENEFNNIRPSHAIGGMTPSEMHLKTENYYNESFITSAKEARKERFVDNKCNACSSCNHTKELKII
jgi:transposase InsO family protein